MTGIFSSLSYGQDQDSAFLACAQYSYRELRVACLEAALEEALRQQNSINNPPGSAPVQGYQRPAANTAANANRVETFGREQQARVVTSSDGKQELMDRVSALNKVKPNMWDITLDSGQVWRQMHPKRFDLRVGDTVHISPSRWGEDYRLTSSRISGFIQVSRVDQE